MEDPIRIKAREFGLHYIQGGWRMGWLVASCVRRGKGQGKRTDLQHRVARRDVTSQSTQKRSAKEFARLANEGLPLGTRGRISDRTVLEYLEGWDKAAMKGLVTHSSELRADDDEPTDLIETELEEKGYTWADFHVKRPTNKPAPRKPAPPIKYPEADEEVINAWPTNVPITPETVTRSIKEDFARARESLKFFTEEGHFDLTHEEVEQLEEVCITEFAKLHKALKQVLEVVKSHERLSTRRGAG